MTTTSTDLEGAIVGVDAEPPVSILQKVQQPRIRPDDLDLPDGSPHKGLVLLGDPDEHLEGENAEGCIRPGEDGDVDEDFGREGRVAIVVDEHGERVPVPDLAIGNEWDIMAIFK